MTELEVLLQQAADRHIEIKEDPLLPAPLKGLYLYDSQPLIILKAGLDEREKLCILAEEVGHCETATVDFRRCTQYELAQQERLAVERAIERLIPFERMITAVHAYFWTRWDFAEYLEVTEEFAQKAMEYYQRKCPKKVQKLKRFAWRNSIP